MDTTATAQAPRRKLICFTVSGQPFGADIANVKETIVMRPITRVPLVPSWVAGIVNLRGDVVAVVDLGALLGLPHSSARGAGARIVIARSRATSATGGRSRTAGLIVDQLDEVRSIEPGALAPPPSTLDPEGAALLQGVATLDSGMPLAVLDLDAFFESERARQFRRKI